LQIQPRRGDLKVAQDAVLGCVQGEMLVPQGRLNAFPSVSAVPPGLAHGCEMFPGLASWATFRSPLPGFPVELGGSGKLHAPFLNERRTRGRVQRCVQEIRVRGWICKSQFSHTLFSPRSFHDICAGDNARCGEASPAYPESEFSSSLLKPDVFSILYGPTKVVPRYKTRFSRRLFSPYIDRE
jgi:hypothetical protein